MPIVERRRIVTADETVRVDRLVALLTERSRAEVRGMFDHGCVTLNAAPCSEPGRLLAAGDSLGVRFDPQRRYHEKPKLRVDPSFRIVFEDEHLIVVDKSAKVLTVPSERSKEKTLVDAVTAHLSRRGRTVRALVVHRLDRGVSGLLVMAKDRVVAGRLQAEIRTRRMEREYLAVVAGTIEPASGTFDTVLMTDGRLNRRSQRDEDDDEEHEEGERAVTHYRTFGTSRDATVVLVKLDTGRRHQIRVHFAEAGHPVLGDRRYRESLAIHPWWPPGRLALHAVRLGFTHPMTGAVLRFESPAPSEFQRFVERSTPARNEPASQKPRTTAKGDVAQDPGSGPKRSRKKR